PGGTDGVAWWAAIIRRASTPSRLGAAAMVPPSQNLGSGCDSRIYHKTRIDRTCRGEARLALLALRCRPGPGLPGPYRSGQHRDVQEGSPSAVAEPGPNGRDPFQVVTDPSPSPRCSPARPLRIRRSRHPSTLPGRSPSTPAD